MSRYLFPVTIGILLLAVAGIGWFLLGSNSAPTTYVPPSTPVAQPAKPQPKPVAMASATMVDEQQCQGCHSAQVKDWQGSHHQLAMQEANAETMLGDFNNVTFKAENETTRFSRKDNDSWVNTPGLDGRNQDFKVAYTFGIRPLQQYSNEVG